MMKHRLPFSNLVIENAPAVMPGNNEAPPYSIVSFDYWNHGRYGGPTFKYFPTRNWRLQTDPPDTAYKANKEQEAGPDTGLYGVFLKFVPRSEFTGSIYVGVVESGPQTILVDDPQYREYSTPCSYQIGVGDCDIKHRPWKNLEITFEVEIVEVVTTYYGNQQDDWEYIDSVETPWTYGIPQTITITESMFDIEPELTVYPSSLGGIGPQYVTGYGEKEVLYSIGESGDIYQTVGAARTFWTLGGSAYMDKTVSVSFDNDNNIVTVTEIKVSNLYISELNPASAYEPPTQ